MVRVVPRLIIKLIDKTKETSVDTMCIKSGSSLYDYGSLPNK